MNAHLDIVTIAKKYKQVKFPSGRTVCEVARYKWALEDRQCRDGAFNDKSRNKHKHLRIKMTTLFPKDYAPCVVLIIGTGFTVCVYFIPLVH